MAEDVKLEGTELLKYLMERFNMTLTQAMHCMESHGKQLVVEGEADVDS